MRVLLFLLINLMLAGRCGLLSADATGDCIGNDAGGETGDVTWTECREICLGIDTCNYFVFYDTPPNGGTDNCYPKTACTGLRTSGVVTKAYDPHDNCGK